MGHDSFASCDERAILVLVVLSIFVVIVLCLSAFGTSIRRSP